MHNAQSNLKSTERRGKCDNIEKLKTYTMENSQLKERHVYEYTIKLILKSGNVIISY